MRDRISNLTMTALFLLLAAGLVYNQLIRFGYYSRLSRNNSIRLIPIDAPRGRIIDRNGVSIVSNRLSFDVSIVYREISDIRKLVALLSGVMGASEAEVSALIGRASRRPYAPFTIMEDIDKGKALTLEEASFDVDGLTIETRSRRYYPFGEAACHVAGYLSEIREDELEGLKDYGYRMGDLVGRSGLEKQYETYLKGLDGGTQIEVNSRGRPTRILGLKEPVNGQDIFVTIDIDLQKACDKLLGERKGAVCALDPVTGEVLALVSHPSFDPNVFVMPDSSKERVALLKDRVGRPMSDRAISGLYPPGSVFKIVTSAAALESGKITRNTQYVCQGTFTLGRSSFDCWKSEGHGPQNVVDALMNSCNVFFYNAGRIAGVDAIEAYAKKFGLGRATGIDLPDEVSGTAPGRAWKREKRRASWFEGETVNYAIGQGYPLTTPLQVADMMAVIANGGKLVKPYVVKKVGRTAVGPEKPGYAGLKADTVIIIRQGLYEVVNNIDGTGKRAKVEGAVIAGKTGTAQNPHGRTHAWFAGFAPLNKPRICVAVFLEHGGKGGLEPSEIARGIFEEARRKGYL